MIINQYLDALRFYISYTNGSELVLTITIPDCCASVCEVGQLLEIIWLAWYESHITTFVCLQC